MNRSVLVVDDEPLTRSMLRILLEMNNFRVFEACDGIDALAKVADARPDVVVMDLMMPNMDGLTACRRLRQEQATADLPVIMLSGATYEQDVQAALQAGANRYMAKPMSTNDLMANINELLQPVAVWQ